MDSFKVGIFLIVIVSGAALGSRNVAMKHYEPKPLIENKEDDSSSTKRIGAGDVISATQLTIDVLKTILDKLSSVKRKIAIGIENNSGRGWEALNVYFFSGTSDTSMPNEVSSAVPFCNSEFTGKALLYNARKTEGPVARGCVGVMAYYIPGLNKTLYAMFSVPFNYNLAKNWWSVALSDGKTKADYARYYEMYYGSPEPYKGDNGWHQKKIGSGLKIRGNMASSGTPTLEIHVNKAD